MDLGYNYFDFDQFQKLILILIAGFHLFQFYKYNGRAMLITHRPTEGKF
jgi:hypothetical protein